MTLSGRIRLTRSEAVIGAVLLCMSLVELFFSDERAQPPTLDDLLLATVPPILVVFSRWYARVAVLIVIALCVLAAALNTPSGTLGAGLAWLVLAFALAAWTPQPWPWLAAFIAATVVRDVGSGYDGGDAMVDLIFLGVAVGAGRVVHRRARQAESLGGRLQVAEAEREARMAEAVTRERTRIARELHDIVAHSVSLMVVQASSARPLAERTDAELAHVLATIETAGREALMELRRLLGVLRSSDGPGLEPVPGVAQLGDLVDGFRSAGLDVRTDLQPLDEVPPSVSLCVYRTVQEGLTNALRYAGGSHVHVSAHAVNGGVRIRVQDHGGVSGDGSIGSGTGLVGLRERVLLCGGTLSAGSSGPGYLLQVDIPPADQTIAVRDLRP